ncbi:MAG TPA: Mor transcription activator family protein [Candidatus Competibacteraceae bacterium]|nr:Mor transcription activator family protein [Candidatus Competibacteraceae bacterium]HRF45115.1 Mor transcription activator family protein [Candidatus Competibacteraceae bacterium]
MMQIPDHYPPILTDIAHLLRARLGQHLPDTTAETLAIACTEDLGLTFSGCQIYIPKQDAMKRAQRDQAIWRNFTGHNHAELASRYKLTVTQIYDILARVRTSKQPG